MRTTIALLLLLGASPFDLHAQNQPDWKQLLRDRLPVFGHRNWVVIADSAYPAQSREGIETIVSNADQLDVLKEVLADISASKHVRAVPYVDRELNFVSDAEAPGMDAYRQQLFALVPQPNAKFLLHTDIINKLDQVSQTFRILIIKTNMTIPYTSVFLELNAAYWSDAAEQELRARMKR
jgi:hypothetical protein